MGMARVYCRCGCLPGRGGGITFVWRTLYVDFVCTPRFFAAFLLAALCLTGLSPLAASASPREGTVEWMLMQPIGTQVTLDTMIVEQVGTDYVDESWNSAVILSSPAAAGNQLYIVAGDGAKRKLYCFGP